MGDMLHEVGSAVGKAVEGPATLPVKVVENAVRTLEGKPFLASTRHDIADATWNIVAAPGRVVWSIIKGLSTGTLRLTWNAIKLLPLPLPMLKSWETDRAKQGLSTHTSLQNLREQLVPKAFSLPRQQERRSDAA